MDDAEHVQKVHALILDGIQECLLRYASTRSMAPAAAHSAGRHAQMFSRSTSFGAVRDVATLRRIARRALMEFSIAMTSGETILPPTITLTAEN
jgi:hypothetical protein